MRIIKLQIQTIEFDQKEYDDVLKSSVKRIGLSFPIKVEVKGSFYHCIDGNKRLTVLKDLGIEEVPAIVVNNGNNRSNDCWRGRNHH
ncbi:ParB N-terminal domain-containing protein [Beduini massiliensis]|uniref:ParB N-terminal domain-containing protein n=1 Tax=Beduini massiliensis TaxID=1585974 RepID=UPI00059A9F2B|nr:ParB N-terminal domain-containing protein [Beduini massiliensis]